MRGLLEKSWRRMSIPEKFKDLSHDIVLPAHLLVNSSLEPNAKMLYGLIRNLTKIQGYCYATNKYLAQLMDVSERTIQRWIESLESEKYLEIEFLTTTPKAERRIFISNNYLKKPLISEENTPPHDKNVVPPTTKMSYPHIYKDLKEENKKEEITPTPKRGSLNRRQKVAEEKKELAPEVHLTLRQCEALQKRAEKEGGSIETVKKAIRMLSDWKIAKGKTGGDDYLNLVRWTLKAVKEEESRDKNVVLAKRILMKINDKKRIRFGKNPENGIEFLEFDCGESGWQKVNTNQETFKQDCFHFIKKLGYFTDQI